MFLKAFLLSVFSDTCKIQLLIPALGAMHFQQLIIGVGIIGLFFSENLFDSLRRGLNSPVGVAWVFWIGWMILSVPFSVYPGGSFKFVIEHLWKLVLSLLLFMAYGNSEKDVNKIISAFIFGVSIFAIGAVFLPARGRFSMIATYDPNDTALLFVSGVPLLFWRAVKSTNRLKRLTITGVILIFVIAIIRTESRGGFLGLLAVLGTSFVQYKRNLFRGMCALILAGSLGMGILSFTNPKYVERVISIFDTTGDYNYSSSSGRIEIWKEGVSFMFSNPLFGVGVNEFMTAHGTYGKANEWKVAHNVFVQVGAELGIAGLLIYIYMLSRVIFDIHSRSSACKADNQCRTFSGIANALIGSWIGFIVCAQFLSMAYSNIFFTLLGISVAFINVKDNRK